MQQESGDTTEQVCHELVDRILTGDIEPEDVESLKLEVCGEYNAPSVPTNGEILEQAPPERREELEGVLRRKPVRTASGVSPVAVMTAPTTCPHGRCRYCPGGPASEFSSAQSYTGHEPAAARGKRNDYDPYEQVTRRLTQLREIGHPVDKVELIIMGGTMTARSHDYQEWFVKEALAAMNDFEPTGEPGSTRASRSRGFQYVEDVIARNEMADVRNVATTFETKPDWCGPEQIDRMLALGGTKVEVGVQTTYEQILRDVGRGHGVQAAIDANRRLREAGFKVGFHMMPGLPGTSKEMVLEDFRRIFEESEWRPDFLKIYPTLVTRDTVTYDMYKRGEFEPLSTEEATELVAEIKDMIPPYTRLQRVQRDIPVDYIEAGVQKSNLRQLAHNRLEEQGGTCDCIRCREVGHADNEPDGIEALTREYEVAGGTEQFLSFEDPDRDVLVGFCRLRFPETPRRQELENAAIVRELHVYGDQVGVGEQSDDWQHQGYGAMLIDRAERHAREAGFDKLAVLSGIGVREYYREKLGYYQDGPYVSTAL